jgi:putative nucleotidyltransferase with HDIG domain
LSVLEQKRLLEFVEKLPGFSPAALKIISIANNMSTSPTEMVNAITLDPSLTARILKLINSAYFGGRSVSSLNRAVMLLGFNTIKNIALSLAVVSSMQVKESFKWFTNSQFWEHSLACAIAAKSMAKAMDIAAVEVEEYFIAGLIHDMGMTALIQMAPEMATIYDPSHRPEVARHDLEKEMLGVSHADLSGMMARKWKFPVSLAFAIESHHAPLTAPKAHRQIALAVSFANHGCHAIKIGIQTPVNIGSISEEERASFPLEPGKLAECLSGLPEAVESARLFLENVD